MKPLRSKRMELKRIEQDSTAFVFPDTGISILRRIVGSLGIRADHFLLLFIEACDDAESRVAIADHDFGCGVPL